MQLPQETMVFKVTATHTTMECFKRLLARLEYNSRVGHSAKVGMALDGDGWDRFSAQSDGYDPAQYTPEMTRGSYAGGGYGVEMASDHGYWLLREKRP